MKNLILSTLVISLIIISCKDKKNISPLLDSEPKEAGGVPIQKAQTTEIRDESTVKIIPIEHATAVLEWKNITIYKHIRNIHHRCILYVQQ